MDERAETERLPLEWACVLMVVWFVAGFLLGLRAAGAI